MCEDLELAANRELVEETGYQAGKLQLIGWYYMDLRRSDIKLYVFLATNVKACKKEGGDAEEFIESSWVPPSTVSKLIADGKLPNPSALSAWSFYDACNKNASIN